MASTYRGSHTSRQKPSVRMRHPRNKECEEARMFCGKCGKPTDPADSFCRNCGVSAGHATNAVQANPAPSAAPVKTKATDQMKLGAVIFVVCLFGACPAAFSSDNDSIRALLVGGTVV